MTDQLAQLREPFRPDQISTVDKGNFSADYVSHGVVNERALDVVGPHWFRVVELIRSDIPDMTTGGGRTHPGRNNAVVGVLAELVAQVDGETVRVTEVGSEERPQMHGDAECAKNAASDAYKRCWMRLGLGLHLWSQVSGGGPTDMRHVGSHSATGGGDQPSATQRPPAAEAAGPPPPTGEWPILAWEAEGRWQTNPRPLNIFAHYPGEGQPWPEMCPYCLSDVKLAERQSQKGTPYKKYECTNWNGCGAGRRNTSADAKVPFRAWEGFASEDIFEPWGRLTDEYLRWRAGAEKEKLTKVVGNPDDAPPPPEPAEEWDDDQIPF